MAIRRFLLLLWLALLCVPASAGAQTFPKLTGRVVDGANLLDPAQEQALDVKLAGIEKATGRQLVVATLPDLQGRDISDYGYRLGREWGIGAKGKNDGALLIVAPKERRVRIEVGYGLEGFLTDAMSALIITNAITPRFKAGDYPGGINAGVDEIGALLKLTPEEAKARAAAMAARARDSDKDANGVGVIVIMVFVGLFFIAPMLLGARGGKGRRYRGGGSGVPIILWGPGAGSSGWGSGGSSSWGSSDGGGFFGGGGGSFGGGGASGDW